MEQIYQTYHPEGFHSLNAYLFTDQPGPYIDFLKRAFLAEEHSRTVHPENGRIQNCILSVGDSCFMVSQSSPRFPAGQTAFYLFVSDVDAMYTRALNAGASSEMEPGDMDYGDRQAGVRDMAGHIWWISMRLQKTGY